MTKSKQNSCESSNANNSNSSCESTINEDRSCSVEETHQNFKKRTNKCVKVIKHKHQDIVETIHVRPIIYKTNRVRKVTKIYKPKVKETWQCSDERTLYAADIGQNNCSDSDSSSSESSTVNNYNRHSKNDDSEITISRRSDNERYYNNYNNNYKKSYKTVKKDNKKQKLQQLWLDVAR